MEFRVSRIFLRRAQAEGRAESGGFGLGLRVCGLRALNPKRKALNPPQQLVKINTLCIVPQMHLVFKQKKARSAKANCNP